MFTHWGPTHHSHGVLTKRMCDPRWAGGRVVWGLCESHPVCVDQNHVQRETIYSKLRKREEYM